MEGNDCLASPSTNFVPNPMYFPGWRSSWPPVVDSHMTFNRFSQSNWNQSPSRCCCDSFAPDFSTVTHQYAPNNCTSNSFSFTSNEGFRGSITNYGGHALGYRPTHPNCADDSSESLSHPCHSLHNWYVERPNPYSSRHLAQPSDLRSEITATKGNKPQENSRCYPKDGNEQILSNRRKAKRNALVNCAVTKNDTQSIKRCCNEQKYGQEEVHLRRSFQNVPSKRTHETFKNIYIDVVDSNHTNLNEAEKTQVAVQYDDKVNSEKTTHPLLANEEQEQELNENLQGTEVTVFNTDVDDVLSELLFLSEDVFQAPESKNKTMETYSMNSSGRENSPKEKNVIFVDEQGQVLSFSNAEILSLSYDSGEIGGASNTPSKSSENAISIKQDTENNLNIEKKGVVYLNERLTPDLFTRSAEDIAVFESPLDNNLVSNENWAGELDNLFAAPGAFVEINSIETKKSAAEGATKK